MKISTGNRIETNISRDKSTAIKGILIMLVLLGHNHFFVDVFSMPIYSWLYSFHVAIFFLLPFFYPSRPLSWNSIGKNAKRLLWPYSYMFLLYAIICIYLRQSTSLNISVLQTYITGDFYSLKKIVGFQYIWFLPAMFSMLLIKDLYASIENKLKLILLIFGLVFFIFSWVFLFHQPYDKKINAMLSSYSILSIMIGCGTFFLGWVTKRVVSNWRWSMIAPVMIILFTLVSMILSNGDKISEWISRIITPIAFMILFMNIELGTINFF